FSSRRRHTRYSRDWSSDVCSSDLDPWINKNLIALGKAGDRFAHLFNRASDFVARSKRKLYSPVFNLHENALRTGITAFPQMQITMTYARALNPYKDLIVLWFWNIDVFDLKRLLCLDYACSLHTS